MAVAGGYEDVDIEVAGAAWVLGAVSQRDGAAEGVGDRVGIQRVMYRKEFVAEFAHTDLFVRGNGDWGRGLKLPLGRDSASSRTSCSVSAVRVSSGTSVRRRV